MEQSVMSRASLLFLYKRFKRGSFKIIIDVFVKKQMTNICFNLSKLLARSRDGFLVR